LQLLQRVFRLLSQRRRSDVRVDGNNTHDDVAFEVRPASLATIWVLFDPKLRHARMPTVISEDRAETSLSATPLVTRSLAKRLQTSSQPHRPNQTRESHFSGILVAVEASDRPACLWDHLVEYGISRSPLWSDSCQPRRQKSSSSC
jgi:hypothetical protein